MAAFFPQDKVMSKKGWECYDNPEGRLASQPLKVRIKKTKSDYQRKTEDLRNAWPQVRDHLTEAKRFSGEFEMQLMALETRSGGAGT